MKELTICLPDETMSIFEIAAAEDGIDVDVWAKLALVSNINQRIRNWPTGAAARAVNHTSNLIVSIFPPREYLRAVELDQEPDRIDRPTE